jgi:PAS fold.
LIVEKKSHLRIVNSNAAFSRLTGISSEDLIGKSLIELLDESFVTENKTNMTLVKLRNALCDGSNVFSLITFPVENKKKAFVTHFALEFSEPHEIESQGTSSTDGAASVPSMSSSKPFNAVG